MAELSSIQVTVHGLVQGVSFRAFTVSRAKRLGIKGYTCNSPNGVEVEVYAEGEKTKLTELVEALRRGPRAARVESVTVKWGEYSGEYSDFNIIYD
jgi:acylphosphatase